jgi:hypothetical protein
MNVLTVLNHTLALLAEIAALVAMVFLGQSLFQDGLMRWVASAVLVAVLMVLWGRFAAPASATRLDMPYLLIFKTGVFILAGSAFWITGHPITTGVFSAAVVVHLVLALSLKIL